MRCRICNEPFGPRGMPIHMAMRHGIHSQRPKGRMNSRMRAAIRDLVALMPPDRFNLLRPETEATIDRVMRYDAGDAA